MTCCCLGFLAAGRVVQEGYSVMRYAGQVLPAQTTQRLCWDFKFAARRPTDVMRLSCCSEVNSGLIDKEAGQGYRRYSILPPTTLRCNIRPRQHGKYRILAIFGLIVVFFFEVSSIINCSAECIPLLFHLLVPPKRKTDTFRIALAQSFLAWSQVHH